MNSATMPPARDRATCLARISARLVEDWVEAICGMMMSRAAAKQMLCDKGATRPYLTMPPRQRRAMRD